MAPESYKPYQHEIEDPIDRRFASAIETAARSGGQVREAFVSYFPRIGDLTVAVVHRPFPPVYSVFAQDKAKDSQDPHFTYGIELTYPDAGGLGREKPQKNNSTNEQKKRLSEIVNYYAEVSLDSAMAIAREVMFNRPSDSVVRGVCPGEDDPLDKLADSLLTPGSKNETREIVRKFRDEFDFEENMKDKGVLDVDPENVEKVAEAIEIVTPRLIWRRDKKLRRAENLLRVGLGIGE